MQTGEANSTGVEIEGNTSLTAGLNAHGSFTYQDVEITESTIAAEVGERPTQVPERSASLPPRAKDTPLGLRHAAPQLGCPSGSAEGGSMARSKTGTRGGAKKLPPAEELLALLAVLELHHDEFVVGFGVLGRGFVVADLVGDGLSLDGDLAGEGSLPSPDREWAYCRA